MNICAQDRKCCGVYGTLQRYGAVSTFIVHDLQHKTLFEGYKDVMHNTVGINEHIEVLLLS